jgi:dTDP-4-dehydrorhamnose reductase
MTQVLVTGGQGQLGKSLAARAFYHPSLNLHFFDLPELDIQDMESIAFIIKELNISIVINAAAYTAVDQAESEPEAAFAVNAIATANMASLLAGLQVPLLHISTDYVFDGCAHSPYREDDPVAPQSEYGRTKLAGERGVMESGVNGLIIRTSWLYSEFGKNFFRTMLRLADERSEIRVVQDQIGSPTYAADLAEAILSLVPQLMGRNGVEIYHFCNTGETSWYGFAAAIMQLAGKTCAVLPIPGTDYPTPAKRPAYSVLNTNKIRRDFNLQIPSWEDGLRRCVENYSISNTEY